MRIELRYAKGSVTLQIPEQNIAKIIRPWGYQAKEDNHTVIQRALSSAGDYIKTLQERIAGKCLCVLLPDGTRDMSLQDILSELCPLLTSGSFVRFLICTGTHNTDTPENHRIIDLTTKFANQSNFPKFDIYANDCEQDTFINAGTTGRGTEVLFNAKADDADVFLVLSDVKCHYFAGYSNPIKNFVPGICAHRTAEQNHSLALDERSTFGMHPWHPEPNRRSNPLAEDMAEAMRMITNRRSVYALVTVSNSKKIQWAKFGAAQQASSEAMSIVDKMNTHTVPSTQRLIVSPGGFPHDESLYTAQRALELTKNAIKDGGEILFLAQCINGIGSERTLQNFYNRLTAPIDVILKSTNAEYKLFSHKPYRFAQMIGRLRRIWVYSAIADNVLEKAHLFPTSDPQSIVDGWLSKNPDVKITIVDGANNVALYRQR